MTYEKNFPLLSILLLLLLHRSSPFAPQCLSVSKVQSFSVTLWGMFFPQINHCCHTKFSHYHRHSCSPPSISSSSMPSAIFLSLCVTHNYAVIDIFYSDTAPPPPPLLCCHSVALFWVLGVATFQKKHKFVTPFDGPFFEGTARYGIVLRSCVEPALSLHSVLYLTVLLLHLLLLHLLLLLLWLHSAVIECFQSSPSYR